MADDDLSPLDHALRHEHWALTTQALAQLATRYREPLLLYYSLGESHSEVAQALGLSEATVRQRLCRARKKLKSELSCVESSGRELGKRASVAASVLLMIQSRGAWASPVSSATGAVWTSPKLFVGLGALAGGALVACVAAFAILLSEGSSQARTTASAEPVPEALVADSGEELALVESPRAQPEARAPKALVWMGTAKLKDPSGSNGALSEANRTTTARHNDGTHNDSARHNDASAASLKGRIKRHGPVRYLDAGVEEPASKPLLQPSLSLQDVRRDLWAD